MSSHTLIWPPATTYLRLNQAVIRPQPELLLLALTKIRPVRAMPTASFARPHPSRQRASPPEALVAPHGCRRCPRLPGVKRFTLQCLRKAIKRDREGGRLTDGKNFDAAPTADRCDAGEALQNGRL